MKRIERIAGVALIAAAAVLSAGPAASQTQRSGQAQMQDAITIQQQRVRGLGSVDLNRDGIVSRDEVLGFQARAFLVADLDSDGLLSENEFIVYRTALASTASPAVANLQFSAVDRDGNGVVDRQEFLSHGDQTYQAVLARQQGQQVAQGVVPGGVGQRPNPPIGVRSSAADDLLWSFEEVDYNNDDIITLDEWRLDDESSDDSARARPLPLPHLGSASVRRVVNPNYNFIAMDRNNDGGIDRQEYEAGRYGQQTAEVPTVGGTITPEQYWSYQ